MDEWVKCICAIDLMYTNASRVTSVFRLVRPSSSVPDMRHVTVAHALTNYRSLSLFLAFMKDNNNKDKEKNLTPPRRSRGSRRLFILQQRTPHVINEF